jgi:hypothetical protein
VGGSINEVGWRFLPLRINDWKLVGQTGASWHTLISWFHQLGALASSWRYLLSAALSSAMSCGTAF